MYDSDTTQWNLFLKINNHRNALLESKKLRLKVPNDIKKIYKLFKKNRKQLFIVGGAVRDAILGKSPKDFDLATDAKPEEVLKIAEKGGFKSLELGKAFGVVVIGGHEIATFRKDIGKGRRPDAVDYTDIEGDVKRRDLTINALFYDIGREEIVDLVGGIKDLKKKQIRTVGTAEKRFDEDPLRKLRALRFTASIGGRVHPDTLMALKKDPSLKGVSAERIRDEFIKSIRKAKSPSKYLRLAQALSMLPQILPGLNINKNFINSNDYIVQIAFMLKDNKPSKLPSKLNSLKYTNKEVNDISFLVSLQNFDPKQIYLYKKMQDKTNLSLQQIKNFGIFIGNEKELVKMYNFKLSVSAKDVPKDLRGKEIGDKIKDLEKEKFLTEAPRKPRKKGQHRQSSSHSDLYTDENPKGTIKGLKFATVKDAQASVRKIKGSGKSHAHKIQAAVAMEQRAKEMGKKSASAVYRRFINSMKKKTKKKNEGWSKKYKKSIDCNNPKGFSQKAHCAGRKKNENKEQISNIQKLLQMYGHSKNTATKMIKKNYKRVVKKFRGDSDRDLAMALIGYYTIGESKAELYKLYGQAMKMMPGSPAQKKIQKKIEKLRKKLGMNEIAVRKKPKKFKDIYNSLPIDLKKRVYNLKNYDQRRDKHPEGNVLKHTIAVTNRALRTGDIDFALAALFHDIGKDSTAKLHPKKGFWTHYGHEHVSAKLVLKYKKWIKSQGGNVLDIYYIVKQHMRMKVFDKMKWTKQKKLSQFRAFDKLKKFSKTMDIGGRGINDSLKLETNLGGYGADAGEPDTMFIGAGEKRKLGTLSDRPEPWFDKGGYQQLEYPVADDIFGGDGQGEKYTAKYKVTDLGATEEYDYSYEENEGYIELDNLSESLLKERIDYLDVATEIVKAYNLKSKVKFATGKTLAEYVPETDTIFLRRSYPNVKEFLITILHEIKHALDARQLGVKKFMKKYTQAGTMATYQGLDPHDDNKWEKRAEKWAQREYKRIKNKFNL